MKLCNLYNRIHGRYERTVSRLLFKRPFAIDNKVPYISFTFDDFPESALSTGGAILEKYGSRGTYYASLGLTGQESPVGRIFSPEQLPDLLTRGHELGCHTFAHCHSWETTPKVFEESIVKNSRALNQLLPGGARSFSYPIACPRPQTKRRTAKYFSSCRGGGQALNAGTADLNQLSAFFLEKCHGNLDPVKSIIDQNSRARGWLILATHDVCENPTPYGCTPSFFEAVLQYALGTGARILPVAKTLEAMGIRA